MLCLDSCLIYTGKVRQLPQLHSVMHVSTSLSLHRSSIITEKAPPVYIPFIPSIALNSYTCTMKEVLHFNPAHWQHSS